MSLVTSVEHDYSPLFVGLKLRLFVRSSTSVFTWWKFALGIQSLLRHLSGCAASIPKQRSRDMHRPFSLLLWFVDGIIIVHCQPVNAIVNVCMVTYALNTMPHSMCMYTLLHMEVKID